MSSIICAVRGCYNNWKKRRLSPQQECFTHKKKRFDCCGPAFNLYPPPSTEEGRRQWLRALNLKNPPKKPYVCSFHFVDGKPTTEHPFPEKWLGYEAPVKRPRRVLVRLFKLLSFFIEASTSDAAEADSNIIGQCDAGTQWEDPSVSDHSYASNWPLPHHQPLLCDRATQCSEIPVYVQLLRNDHLSLLYTGLPLDAFTSLGDDLTEDFNNGFHLHPRDQLLMTLMKLRLNLLQDDIAERFHVSQPCVSKVISCWLDLMEKRLRPYIPWLPRETIKATMPQCFREHFPSLTCIIDCSEVPLQKPHNLDSRGESYSHYYGQNTIKFLIAVAPCGLIMFISPGYGGRCSDKFITTNSGFLEYLRPGDQVMADRGFVIQDLLLERRVKLVIPAFTKKSMQLSEEDTTNTRRIANVRVHVERVLRRLKNYRVISQTVPISLAPKYDKILRVCAALYNLRGDIIHDGEE
ncbi:hypothetical protein ACEWY4_000219 [Coilia grayii]|uniref:THAP-type domain-containing protein n=1 Tax=Coilia grayii TaxID=363190 RepID=A0ABD1KWL5_9TELE